MLIFNSDLFLVVSKLFDLFRISKNISFEDVLLCGSYTLGIYGIREPKDIDYLSLVLKEENEIFQGHFKELKHYGYSIEELIYDP